MNKLAMLLFFALVVALPVYIVVTKRLDVRPLAALTFAVASSILAIPLAMLTSAFAPFYVPYLVLTELKKAERRTALAWSGIAMMAVFAITITFPFHFQGYKELGINCMKVFSDDCGPGKGLGITQYDIPNIYSYALTFQSLGYVYLFTAGLAAIFGKFTKNPFIDYTAKFVVVGFIAFTFLEFDQYEIINSVME
jgi:hypothetical protein